MLSKAQDPRGLRATVEAGGVLNLCSEIISSVPSLVHDWLWAWSIRFNKSKLLIFIWEGEKPKCCLHWEKHFRASELWEILPPTSLEAHGTPPIGSEWWVSQEKAQCYRSSGKPDPWEPQGRLVWTSKLKSKPDCSKALIEQVSHSVSQSNTTNDWMFQLTLHLVKRLNGSLRTWLVEAVDDAVPRLHFLACENSTEQQH